MNDKITLVCPAGIGDVAWVIAKVWSVRDQIAAINIVDGKPRRTTPFVRLAGFESDYDSDVTYDRILNFEALHELMPGHMPTWQTIRNVKAAQVLLEANHHLEDGRRLEDWLPDLPTDFHFPLHVHPKDSERAEAMYLKELSQSTADAHGPVVLINCASFQGAEAWHAWALEEWKDCVRRIMSIGWRPFILGGYWDDLSYAVACDLELPNLVGRTHEIGVLVALLARCRALITFSSGLNVIRTILDLPAYALWPSHQNDLRNSWAPPDMLDSRRYVSSLWHPVADVWPSMKKFLRDCEDTAFVVGTRARPNGPLQETAHEEIQG